MKEPRFTDMVECVNCGHTITMAEARRLLAGDGRCPICGESKPKDVLDQSVSTFVVKKEAPDGSTRVLRVPEV